MALPATGVPWAVSAPVAWRRSSKVLALLDDERAIQSVPSRVRSTSVVIDVPPGGEPKGEQAGSCGLLDIPKPNTVKI